MNVPLTFKQFNILMVSIFVVGIAVLVLGFTVLSNLDEWFRWVGFGMAVASFIIPFYLGHVIELKQ